MTYSFGLLPLRAGSATALHALIASTVCARRELRNLTVARDEEFAYFLCRDAPTKKTAVERRRYIVRGRTELRIFSNVLDDCWPIGRQLRRHYVRVLSAERP